MSGTSLDGVDIAYCLFNYRNSAWNYKIIKVLTIPYKPYWQKKLAHAFDLSASDFTLLNAEYGHFLGKLIIEFINQNNIRPDFICSHGHTVFHKPSKKVSVQIGLGSAIAAETGMIVISDFRTTDVALSGQGAPLVPIGDLLLFKNYKSCLNIGGFANISVKQNSDIIAYDICPANIVLNKISTHLGKSFDKDGLIARQGDIIKPLLKQLNQLAFYRKTPPKSLGNEWLLKNFNLIVENYLNCPADVLRTLTEHIALQISKQINSVPNNEVLTTGGGAYNKFLVERINNFTKVPLVIPEKSLIEFKEAIIFGFLGLLRFLNQANCLKSVTGSKYNNCGGAIYNGSKF